MKRCSLVFGWLALLVAAAGCSTFTRTGGVTASVVNVAPTQASLFETTVGITLRLTNEAAEPRVLTGSSHRLFLNGTYVGRGVSNERVGLPPFGVATQTITVYVENLTLMRKFSEFQSAPPPTIDYRFESDFHAEENRHVGTVRTIATGQLDVRGLMNAASGMLPAN
jgi:LEA14-like dessication related protein